MFWRVMENMKGKYDTLSGYKEKDKSCFVYLECKLQQRRSGLMHFQIKMGEKGTENRFRDKQTTK